MPGSVDDTPPARGDRDPAASFFRLLAADDRGQAAGGPLLTGAGRVFVQGLINQARADADATADETDRPRWDGRGSTLYRGWRRLKTFRKRGSRQAVLLAAFEAAGWPAGPIANPLPPEPGDSPEEHRGRLHNTVKNLNRELPPDTIRFREDGERVWWVRCLPAPTD
jgi:hypothetical protein